MLGRLGTIEQLVRGVFQVDGAALETGFTTAWPPNKAILVGNPAIDVDIVSRGEKSGGPTYAAITSRSHHPGGVNALFADGSVRFVKNAINGHVWRSLGSVVDDTVGRPHRARAGICIEHWCSLAHGRPARKRDSKRSRRHAHSAPHAEP